MKKIIILLISLTILLPSCMTTRTYVGTYREQEGKVYTYSRGKQMYLFWGLIPLGRTRLGTPADGNCEVRTCYNFWDALLSCLTGGIFEMQTIKVKAKEKVTPQIKETTINTETNTEE